MDKRWIRDTRNLFLYTVNITFSKRCRWNRQKNPNLMTTTQCLVKCSDAAAYVALHSVLSARSLLFWLKVNGTDILRTINWLKVIGTDILNQSICMNAFVENLILLWMKFYEILNNTFIFCNSISVSGA